MSFLDTLTINQKNVIISVPYRAGLWVSRSDQTGGEEASAQELQVLSNIINGFAEEVFGSEIIQHIISETVNSKDAWPVWSAQLSTLLADCEVCIDTLREKAGEKEVSVFQNHIMEIGEAVALAFNEFEHARMPEKIRLNTSFVGQKIAAALGRHSYKSYREFINISMAERQALQQLAQALGTRYV